MAGPQQQPQQSGDDWVWVPLGIIFLLCVIWYVKHAWISNVWLRLKWAEAWIFSFFSDSVAFHAKGIASILSNGQAVSALTFGQLWKVSSAASFVWGILSGCVMLYLAFRILTDNVRAKVRNKLDMEKLMKIQQDEWPYIRPVAGLDLINDKSEKWAPALRPETTYDSRGRLLEKGLVDKHGLITSRLFDRRKAAEVFVKQVGRPWPSRGWVKLKKHERALYGVFAARIALQKDEAREALKQMSINMGPGGDRSLQPGIALAEKYGKHKDVLEVVSRHRYVTSVLAGLHVETWQEGILASSEFIWLRPMDRNLWYLLNSTGRRVPHPEAAGSFGNYGAERVALLSNKKRAELISRREQKEAAMHMAAEQNLNISIDPDDSGLDSDIPEPIILTGPVVEEAVEALYQYMKEKDLCE